jgi:NADH dehydrogenase
MQGFVCAKNERRLSSQSLESTTLLFMSEPHPAPLHVVTGAFGFSGSRIARRLLETGIRVRTLTNSRPTGHPLAGHVEVRPLDLMHPGGLVESLRGAAVLYNTYWVRFNHKRFTFAQAIANSSTLFLAAREAGVGRIVHVSVANPSLDSPFEYFRGKAQVEAALRGSGVPHTILRPAVLFGEGDILINNIAWGLRTFPVFGVFGDGEYRLQPIFVEDFAELAVAEGAGVIMPRQANDKSREGIPAGAGARKDSRTSDVDDFAKLVVTDAGQSGNRIIDAIGPETFTYRGLVEMLREAMGLRTPIISVSQAIGHALTRFAGLFTRDVILTREEIGALMADLLCTQSEPLGMTRLSDWARAHADELGREYASELARRH